MTYPPDPYGQPYPPPGQQPMSGRYQPGVWTPPAQQPVPEWQQPGARLQQVPLPRRRRRVFMWVFLAVQAAFVIWLAVGISSAHGSNSAYAATQAAKFCDHGGWSPLYSSQAQCLSDYGSTLKDAGNAGTAIGAGVVVLLWVVTDIIMGVTYLVVRLSRRRD